MTSSREMVLIGGIANALSARGSWTGETHIQKTAFVAKVRRNVPLESEFVLYKHGPFSFDLSKSIAHMLSRGLLTAEPNPGYGPSLRPASSLWHALDTGLGGVFATYEAAINSICDRFARKNVADLERVATAIWVSAAHPQTSIEQRGEIIIGLKPHISRESAIRALAEAEEI